MRWLRGDWNAESLNISCWAYRDVNRNGVYDVGDRSWVGLRVELDRPDGSVVASESNRSGFANFKMGRRGDIRSAGTYRYRALPPDGWQLTSEAALQSVAFRELPGSPVGIVAQTLCVPMGITPRLAISGRIAADTGSGSGDAAGSGSVSLVAISSSGVRADVAIDRDGRFALPADAGEWRLILSRGAGNVVERTVRVADYPVVVAALSGTPPDRPPAPATRTIGFDSLTSAGSLIEVPNGYAGLRWTNWVATHPKVYEAAGLYNATVSGEFVAYNSSGHPATIASGRPFDFAGTYLSVIWPGAEAREVIVRGWRGERLAHEERMRLRSTGPIWFDADWRGLTRLEFSHDAYWQVVVDDLTLRVE